MFSGPTLFCWGLAATNAAALGAFAAQWRPLISSRGVLPAKVKVEAWEAKLKQRLPHTGRLHRCWAAFWQHRSLLAVFGASDAALVGLFALGFAGVVSLVAGILPSLGALACYLAYSSLHSVSQPWLGLQMDVAISECNLLFAVLYALSWASPSAWVVAQRWLVWRTMVACGVAKWSGGDPSWRVFRGGGSAMSYHYWTQPLPNPLSRMAHFAPQWFHAFETAMTYVVEIVVPLLYVAPSPLLRWLSFVLTVGFNAVIGSTGNYGHLHLLTITEAIAVVIDAPDSYVTKTAPAAVPFGLLSNACETFQHPALLLAQYVCTVAAWVLTVAYVILSLPPLLRTFQGLVMVAEPLPFWHQVELWSARATRWALCNYYSKFTHMTKIRWELQIEVALQVAQDPQHRIWYQLETVAKPGGGAASLSRMPPMLPIGYNMRFEWRSWFVPNSIARVVTRGLPLTMIGVEEWYRAAMHALLQRNEVVWRGITRLPAGLALPDVLQRLQAVRVSVYSYTFTKGERGHAQAENAEQAMTAPAGEPDDARVNPAARSITANAPAASSSDTGVFPREETGSVWSRKRMCSYYVAHRPGVQLSASEIMGSGQLAVRPIVEAVSDNDASMTDTELEDDDD